MLISLTNSLLRDYLEAAYGTRPPEDMLHLVGLRNGLYEGDGVIRIHDPRPDCWDDSGGTFGTELHTYPSTTDPGTYWTKNPSNPAGAAHLCEGIWQYQLGLHKGNPALVQAGEVTVRRDSDEDAVAEGDEPLDTGWFGVNLHSGPAGDEMPVDSWSAGCQVWPEPGWSSFYYLCENSGQSQFAYHLIDCKDLGAWVREGGVYPYE